jgi:hypothetical protein
VGPAVRGANRAHGEDLEAQALGERTERAGGAGGELDGLAHGAAWLPSVPLQVLLVSWPSAEPRIQAVARST